MRMPYLWDETLYEKRRPDKCIICGWDKTIDTHHESGNEYPLCPNHRSLITRKNQTLEKMLLECIRMKEYIK